MKQTSTPPLHNLTNCNHKRRGYKTLQAKWEKRYRAHIAAGNWDAMAEIIADDFFGDDRRRVVGSGVRIGREAQTADMRAIADLFIADMTWTNMATRGDRLVLFRVGFLDRDQKPDAFRTEVALRRRGRR